MEFRQPFRSRCRIAEASKNGMSRPYVVKTACSNLPCSTQYSNDPCCFRAIVSTRTVVQCNAIRGNSECLISTVEKTDVGQKLRSLLKSRSGECRIDFLDFTKSATLV